MVKVFVANENGKIELTLITCDNDNTKRLVVKCRV